MRHWYAGLSLRMKITGITIGITMLSLAAVASIGILQIGNEISAEQHRTADSVALGIARASELAMTVGDTQELSRLANTFLHDQNVLFVAIYGSSSKPLASGVGDPQAWDQFSHGAVSKDLGIVGTRTIESFAHSDEFSSDADLDAASPSTTAPSKATPTHSHVVGQVVVCISTAPTKLAEQQQIRLTVAATAAAAILGTGILFLTLRSWMRRLQALATASQSISRGNFDVSVNDPHDDEIAHLGQCFESMRLAVRDRDTQLRKFADTLQEQVKQRTHDLEGALAVAEEASRAKSLFLANMSHELRTPLNGVIGMVDLLLATQPSAQQRRYCEVAKSSARSLLELINDILDFSKIEAGKLELDSTDFSLHELIENVTQMLGQTAERKKIELICGIGQGVPRTICGDPTRLRQIVLNLVTNAIKFTEDGEVVINAAVLEQTATRALLKISVKDSGIGIPKERLTRLFKSFSQVDASTTRKFGGTGLGLAISQRLVEMMGGEIGVDSEEGHGSIFWIKLRVEKRATLPSQVREIGVDPRGLRALVVDDNSTNREILQAQLTSWRLQADVAGSASEAIEMLESAVANGAPYRFAILDMRMPKVDGMQLAGEIKSNPRTRDVILISLSSMGDPLKTEEMNRVGFAACLTKPALPSQLFDAIVDSLAAHEKPANVAAAAAPPAAASIRLDGIRILLAEDNAVNRFVASELLTNLGCVCLMAENGHEAVEMALGETHDVILMDCQMPELDGFEATRNIRKAEKAAGNGTHRPIIALTANAIKGDRELCLAAGMDDYVTKPIEPVELFSAIRRHLPADRRAAIIGQPNPATSNAASVSVKTTDQPIAPPIDLNTLQQRCMGNHKLASKALKIFESSLATDVGVLLESVSKGDAKAAAASAHKIKGSAANVSAEQVRAVAGELEKLAKADSLAQASDSLDQLDREMRRFKEYLSTALGELAPREQPANEQPGASTAKKST
jgi:signal transduction histidine kinase/CheY-like chemotaxis protein/HPt (histidine-containing phosphotransfer) domain-containing protein